MPLKKESTLIIYHLYCFHSVGLSIIYMLYYVNFIYFWLCTFCNVTPLKKVLLWYLYRKTDENSKLKYWNITLCSVTWTCLNETYKGTLHKWTKFLFQNIRDKLLGCCLMKPIVFDCISFYKEGKYIQHLEANLFTLVFDFLQ